VVNKYNIQSKTRRESPHITRQYYDLILVGQMAINEFLANLGVDLTFFTQYFWFYQSMKGIHRLKLRKENKKLM
jgi:hypothetical protein